MKALFCILLILLLLMPGCGTYIMMMESDGHPIPYSGVMIDALVFAGFITSQEGLNGILIALWALVDLPFSLVADTLCLPYTIFKLF